MSDLTQTQKSEPDGDSSGSIDYAAVEIPAEPASEYHYTQRRAEILDIIEAKGHPDAVSRKELADRYDVSPSQISRDISRLADHVADRVGDRDHRAMFVESVVKRGVRELLDEGEHRAAVKSASDYAEWAREFHDLEELAEEVDRLKASHGSGSSGVNGK
jgi:DNA-binding transcriptional ArsR family regulator